MTNRILADNAKIISFTFSFTGGISWIYDIHAVPMMLNDTLPMNFAENSSSPAYMFPIELRRYTVMLTEW